MMQQIWSVFLLFPRFLFDKWYHLKKNNRYLAWIKNPIIFNWK